MESIRFSVGAARLAARLIAHQLAKEARAELQVSPGADPYVVSLVANGEEILAIVGHDFVKFVAASEATHLRELLMKACGPDVNMDELSGDEVIELVRDGLTVTAVEAELLESGRQGGGHAVAPCSGAVGPPLN
jgi:hypothetical protein